MTYFRRATFYSVFGLALLTFLWIFDICIPHKSDLEAYRAFLEKSKVIASSKEFSKADQRREKVRKDLWITEADKTRLHTRLESDASTLTLLPLDDKVDIIENLETIRCWMQDKLFLSENTPMQQVRFFEAGQGTYHYMDQQFLAKAVTLSLFRLPGHALPFSIRPSDAFLKGVAKDVSFSVGGKASQFQAQQFKATLKNEDL